MGPRPRGRRFDAPGELVRHRHQAHTLRRHEDVYSLIVGFVRDVHNRLVLEVHSDHEGVVFGRTLSKSSVVKPTTLTESIAVGIDRQRWNDPHGRLCGRREAFRLIDAPRVGDHARVFGHLDPDEVVVTDPRQHNPASSATHVIDYVPRRRLVVSREIARDHFTAIARRSHVFQIHDVLADARRFISTSVPLLPLLAHLPSKVGLARHRVHSLTVPHPAAIGGDCTPPGHRKGSSGRG